MIESIQNIGNQSLILLVFWIIFASLSLLSYFKFQKLTGILLFFTAVFLAAAFALFTPYFFTWDEQFHALVGKHLVQNPLFPSLYLHDPLHLDTQNWVNAHIWLHKQPLFTWQIALSIKLLGNTVFAVRLPSVIFHGLLVAAIYRIGSLTLNRKTGFIAAILVLHSSFLLGLISGRIGTDHNDFIFLCYITFSFWAWFEFQASQKQKWLIWIGVFAGCAILTKWLVGLLVFGAWAAVILQQFNRETLGKDTLNFLKALGVTFLVFMPWQIYTFWKFPIEAAQEIAYNFKHISQIIEKHDGSIWYHYEQIQTVYFQQLEFFCFLILGIIALILAKKPKKILVFTVSSIVLIYAFFTYVPTKMPAFTVPVYGLVLLVIAFGLTHFSAFIQQTLMRRIVLVLLVSVVSNWLLKPNPTLIAFGFKNNTKEQDHRFARIKAQDFIIKNGQNNPQRIVFGINGFEFANISWMYFNSEIAYPFLPSPQQIELSQKAGYKMVVFDMENE